MPHGKQNKKNASGAGTIRKKTVIRNGKEYVYWEARFTIGFDPGTGKQKQKSITGKTQKEVAQKLRQITTEVDQGTYREASKLTVGSWLDIWESTYLGNLKPRTLESYQCQIKNHIRPCLGSIKLEGLTTPTIQKFYNDLSKALSPKSVKIAHGVLHRALQQAVLVGHIRANPADHCTLPRLEKKEMHVLDGNSAQDFLRAIKGHRFENVFGVTLFTGMRQGEVLGLTWDCVDLEQGCALVNKQLQKVPGGGGTYTLLSPKNGKGRLIALAPYVVDLLKSEKAKQEQWKANADVSWQDGNFVFSDELGGHLMPHTVYHNYKKVVAEIGCPELRYHDLRHSYAVAAIRSGDDIKTVQGNLGHATASFTLDVYGHVTDEMKRQSAERMQNYIENLSKAP